MPSLKIGKLKQEQITISNYNEITNQYYAISETLDLDLYYDITSNISWMTIGRNFYDYGFCRNEIKILTNTIGFGNLKDLEEQKCASQYFVVSKINRDLVHTELDQEKNWGNLIVETKRNREERWSKAKSYISYILQPIYSTDLALSTETLSKNFIEYGVESIIKDNVTGLFDWLNDTYPTKTYFTQLHKDKLISILSIGY